MIPKTLIIAFMASCLVSSSVASPCKASSLSIEVSSYTTIEPTSTTTGDSETSTVFPDSTTETDLSSTVTATSTVSQEATPTSDASSTGQPPTVPVIPIDCSTDGDCDEALGRGIYACIDLLCRKTATAP